MSLVSTQAKLPRHAVLSAGPERSHSQALLELFAPRARDFDLHAVPELNVAVAAGRFEQRVHAIELHDGRAVDAEKARGVELVLQVLHRFANEVLTVAHDQLGVRPAGQDVVDLRHRDEADFPARLDGNALEIPRPYARPCARRRLPDWCLPAWLLQ